METPLISFASLPDGKCFSNLDDFLEALTTHNKSFRIPLINMTFPNKYKFSGALRLNLDTNASSI